MRKHAREVDEFVENVQHGASLGTAAARDDVAARALAFHEVLGDDDRFYDEYVVLFQEDGDLVSNRR
jgi:hypothetical protein